MSNSYTLPPTACIGSVHLTVSDLNRSLSFYGGALGFRTLAREPGRALLSADGRRPLVELSEAAGARPKPPRTTGLYHFALLYAARADLARALRRLLDTNYPLQGAADHLVSEAIYLADPDGNGIEIYADRPRVQWPRRDDQLQMATDPLDFESLMAELQRNGRAWAGAPAGTTLGHIHLHVHDLQAAQAFYCDLLGFEVMLRYGPSALFVSAGGYHHHIGLNTWAGVGAPPPPEEAAGLRAYDILLPERESWEGLARRLGEQDVAFSRENEALRLRDPAGNGIRVIYERR